MEPPSPARGTDGHPSGNENGAGHNGQGKGQNEQAEAGHNEGFA